MLIFKLACLAVVSSLSLESLDVVCMYIIISQECEWIFLRTIPEFRILRLTFHRKYQNTE